MIGHEEKNIDPAFIFCNLYEWMCRENGNDRDKCFYGSIGGEHDDSHRSNNFRRHINRICHNFRVGSNRL